MGDYYLSNIKKIIKRLQSRAISVLPFRVRRKIREIQHHHWKDEAESSVQDVFTRIYHENKWGGNSGEYSSGSGSSDPSVLAYVALIKNFIKTNNIKTVIDLGCGDFKVGSQLQIPGVSYIGIDIVDSLINHNQSSFGNSSVSFLCRDIIKDELPEGELCLIRQVLQHLSNQEIAGILHNTQKYKYAIITEHYPGPSRHIVPNKDKIHNDSTRLLYDSAVYLDLPPFNAKVSGVLMDVEIGQPAIRKGERLKTFLIEHK
jgi:hypothetical protein